MAAKTPLYCFLAGILSFSVLWMICLALFTALLIAAEPTRNNFLGILSVVVLMLGTSAAATTGLIVYSRCKKKHEHKLKEAEGYNPGEVYIAKSDSEK
jgi:hypothetical protein